MKLLNNYTYKDLILKCRELNPKDFKFGWTVEKILENNYLWDFGKQEVFEAKFKCLNLKYDPNDVKWIEEFQETSEWQAYLDYVESIGNITAYDIASKEAVAKVNGITSLRAKSLNELQKIFDRLGITEDVNQLINIH